MFLLRPRDDSKVALKFPASSGPGSGSNAADPILVDDNLDRSSSVTSSSPGPFINRSRSVSTAPTSVDGCREGSREGSVNAVGRKRRERSPDPSSFTLNNLAPSTNTDVLRKLLVDSGIPQAA